MTTPDPWDDERLSAGFAARDVSAQVPPDLAAETANAVRGQPTRNDATWWRALPIAAGAAVVLVVSVVGLGLTMPWRTESPLASTEPSGLAPSIATPTTLPSILPSPDSQTDPSVPSVVQGLPVVNVREAIKVQAIAGDDRELAVHGWLSVAPGMSCVPSERPVSPLAPHCHSELNWFLQDPEVLIERNGADVEIHEPTGAAIHPSFAYGPPFTPPDAMPPVAQTEDPWPIVAVGHFDDRMAAACEPDVRGICADRFVVDRLAWIAGVTDQIVYEVNDQKVQTQPDEIIEILSSLLPASPVLSLRVVPGRGLVEFDGTLPKVSEQLSDETRVWVVRVLDGTRAASVYVTDDDHEAFELSTDGGLIILSASSGAPALQDGHLAVVGVDGGPGELSCNKIFPVSGLTAPTGAEDRVGPEFDVLRATVADPGLEYGAADGNTFSWREAGRTDDTVVFLAEKPTNGDERYWLELSVRRDPTGWRFIGGGDCFPRAILPDGVGPATWVLDPAYPNPSAQDTTVHLLVTESTCAGGEPADGRLAPAYVVADPYRIEITIGVATRPGAQRCPLSPPTAVEIDLGSPIGDRPLIDPNAPPPDGTSG